MNKKAGFAVQILKEYALENQTTARGTKIILPLEMRWLPKEDITTVLGFMQCRINCYNF